MTAGVQLLIIAAMLLIFLFFGCPVMAAIGMTAVGSMLIFMDSNFWSYFASITYQQATELNQLIPPLFILMAEFLSHGGIAEDIFAVLNKLLKKVRGGLAIATTLACTVFAALCGSSPATAASVGRIATDAMTKRGYRKDLAIGTVSGAGTLGIMIPPSITLVVFGILTETSIAKLLMAGFLPGIMLALLMVLSIVIRAKINPNLVGEFKPGDTQKPGFKADMYALPPDKLEEGNYDGGGKLNRHDLIKIIPAAILIVLVIGSLYTGICTPTESAAVGVLGALAITFIQRRFTKKLFLKSLKSTARTSSMMVFLCVSGYCLSFVLAYLKIPSAITQFIINSGMNKYVLLIMLYIMWLILGCLMDPGSMVILTVPFLFETMVSLGFDPVWLGVVSCLCTEIGMISPPVGLNLFVLKANTNVDMKYIMSGSVPYIIVLLIGLVLLTIFPEIALFLPNRM